MALASYLPVLTSRKDKTMTGTDHASAYALGSTDAEHERLIRQAARLAPLTERFFREAGIGTGQRVLDLGSGMGDVAMLAAKLVGPTGEIVGVERDSKSISRARSRIAEARVPNVRFTQCDVSQIQSDKPFDAAVGRFVLQFVPDPVAVLGSVAQLVRSGGVLAFQEVSYAPCLALCAQLPLWTAAASVLHTALQSSGADTEMGIRLYQMFQKAGLPAPHMHMEMQLGNDPGFTRWTYDLLCSLRPQIREHNVSLEPLGDFETLPQRLQAEVEAAQTVVPFVGLIGAWSRKPGE
jgi:ubiquinone/menaquinone biosynthesis C-methylase UbiE